MPALASQARQPSQSAMSSPALDANSFRALATLVKAHTGIVLSDHKRDLVQGRLARRLRALSLPDYAAYCALLASSSGEQELGPMINAMTTNVTRFFREPYHFEILRQTVLPQARATGSRFRLWSAGCSTGEEPYSIAMTLVDTIPDPRWDARILATDIDSDVLTRARAGHYDEEGAQTIPAPLRRRFVAAASGGGIEIRPEIRARLAFKQLNLMADWPMQGPLDVIFCRNVVIYFDKETQARTFTRFAQLLRPGGWLFLGHSETLHGVGQGFSQEGRTAYRKRA